MSKSGAHGPSKPSRRARRPSGLLVEILAALAEHLDDAVEDEERARLDVGEGDGAVDDVDEEDGMADEERPEVIEWHLRSDIFYFGWRGEMRVRSIIDARDEVRMFKPLRAVPVSFCQGGESRLARLF